MAMETKEIGNLIGSDKVEGTAVYGSDERKIGSIERVMIDKKSGRVSYAVLGFGGIAGAAVGIAKFLFWAGIIIAVVLFLLGMTVAKKVS